MWANEDRTIMCSYVHLSTLCILYSHLEFSLFLYHGNSIEINGVIFSPLFKLCLCSAFGGNDIKRGQLHFEGNLLFTHCGEIDSPEHPMAGDETISQTPNT